VTIEEASIEEHVEDLDNALGEVTRLERALQASETMRADMERRAVEAEQHVADLNAMRQRYRYQIRCEAEAIRKEMGWCRSGVREHLANLGLTPLEPYYSGTVTIEVRIGRMFVDEDVDTIEGRVQHLFRGVHWDGNDEANGSVDDVEIRGIAFERDDDA
jgi:hypothetical protein